MKNKIDQFFKDKVEGHSLSSSEESWAKVEANLSKKNNAAVWRIAAAILIAGALISVIIWSQRNSEKNQPVISTKKSPKEKTIKEKPVLQLSSIEKKANSNSTSPRSVSSQTESKIPRPNLNLPQTEKSDQRNKQESDMWSVKTQTMAVEASEDKPAKASEDKEKEKIKSEATQPAAIASTKQKPIKLEFTLEDFFSQENAAALNEEKNSGLKKVWNLAREVKNGEGPVREIKNELFALNFRKNKNQ